MQPLFAVITMPLDPIIVRIGGLAIHWYGLFIALAILANVPIARREAIRKGISEEKLFNLAVWAVVFGVIGGRLYYVVQADQSGGFAYYLKHPQDILATWQGGMAFYGMIVAVLITAGVYCRLKKLPFWGLMDIAAVVLPLGQAIGRLGNLVNGDIVGYKSNLPWAIRYPNPNSLAPDHVSAFQPASVYEMIFSLALFGFLWAMRKRIKTPGLLFALYAFLYSVGQFGIFYLRANSITALDLKQAQLTALAVMLLTLPLMAYLLRRSSAGNPPPGGVEGTAAGIGGDDPGEGGAEDDDDGRRAVASGAASSANPPAPSSGQVQQPT
ncbi:MAG: prolipoprotein diacylglyceryl transferase [Chloroflexota bacterium]